jgi:PiT family inorganic phosphate transporter
VANSPEFLQAVVVGAGLCVLLATLRGFPISTTHSLTGALVGAGFMAVGQNVNLEKLAGAFFLPLLVSPLLAVVLAGLLYLLAHRLRRLSGVTKEWCVCIGEKFVAVSSGSRELAMASSATLELEVANKSECAERYTGRFLGIHVHSALDAAHYLSAGVVSFARGLNDTPKIVAALLGLQAFGVETSMLLVAITMAIGGLVHARKIADTVSKKITPLNHGQGFTANLVTGFLVVVASRMGVPVSTTHVSVGSLFGIGTVTGQADKRKVAEILAAWVLTLPIAAALAATAFLILS